MFSSAPSANRSSVAVRKSKEWGNLSWFLFRFGVDIPSYTSYKRAGLYYLADVRRSDRYTKCIKYNKPACNVFRVSVLVVERMTLEEEKLRLKAEAT